MPFRRLFAAGVVGVGVGSVTGCGGSSEAPVPAPQPVPVVADATPPTPAPAPPPPAPKPAPQPEPFRFPDDAGGKKVAAALAPAAVLNSQALPVPAAKPRPRAASDIDRGEVPLPKVAARVPASPLPAAKVPRPTPPPDRVPADLGRTAAEDPSRLRLPDRPLVSGGPPANPGAADLPVLGRQLPDRASLDDPTADLASVRVVFTALPVPFSAGWFARFGIPDPFEWADQMRGRTGADRELGTAPAAVPPARP